MPTHHSNNHKRQCGGRQQQCDFIVCTLQSLISLHCHCHQHAELNTCSAWAAYCIMPVIQDIACSLSPDLLSKWMLECYSLNFMSGCRTYITLSPKLLHLFQYQRPVFSLTASFTEHISHHSTQYHPLPHHPSHHKCMAAYVMSYVAGTEN